jgi:dTDP-4-amino-4,6-dideoxygalactose transaminase
MKKESHPTWPPHTESMEQAFAEIYSSGDWWKYTGERVKKLEREFPGSHDCRFGVSTCNGSVAIDIALKALDLKPEDEVILPAYDFYSLPKSVLNVGATPVFADVTASNLTIDREEVQKKISSRTRESTYQGHHSRAYQRLGGGTGRIKRNSDREQPLFDRRLCSGTRSDL